VDKKEDRRFCLVGWLEENTLYVLDCSQCIICDVFVGLFIGVEGK